MKQFYPFILLAFLICQFNTNLFAQLSPGSTAPDFTVTDIDGVTHNLYDMLNQGKTVYLEFSATWCGPCWNFHNSGAFEEVWDEHGPSGTDQARVFFIEADLNTPLSCLFGNCSNTLGDWTAGVSFPIVNLTSGNGASMPNDYNIAYFPTIYAVCPDKRVYETGQVSSSILETYINSCGMKESSVTLVEENCYGDGNGMIDLEIEGGESPIYYSWSNGAGTQDLNGISAGMYTVTMTDANSVSYSTSFTLDGPTQELLLDNNNILEVDCYGADNAILSLAPYGGTPPYNAMWNDGNTDLFRNNVAAGDYFVTVTDDNGCSKSESYTVTQPPELTLYLEKLDEACGLANGFIAAESSGGSGTHIYDIGEGPTYDPLFDDLQAGNYTVSVTDDHNCITTNSIELFNVPGPEANAPANLDLECAGEVIQIDASASNPGSGTTILWTTTDGNIVSGENSLTPSVDAPGTYTLTLSNAQTCDDHTETVVHPNPGQPTADAGEDQQINCQDPIATIGSNNSSSGNNITYLWKNDQGIEIGNTLLIEVNEAGNYTLHVTNTSINCTSTSSVEVVQAGGSVTAQVEVDGSLNCRSDGVVLNSEGSSNGQHIVYTWVDENGNELGYEVTLMINAPGQYTLIVTDTLEECSSEKSIVVQDDKDAPIVIIEGDDSLTCFQNEVLLEAQILNLDSNYIVQWKDQAGDEIGQDLSLSVREPGLYTLVVTNEINGCSSQETFNVSRDQELPSIIINQPANLSCLVTEVIVDASGSPQGPEFTYEWTTIEGDITGPTNGTSIVVGEPGTYFLEVTNNENGCKNSQSVVVNGYDQAPIGTLYLGSDGIVLNTNATVDNFYNDVLWDFGDGNFSSDLENTHVYHKSGIYNVCLTLTNDCGESTYCEKVVIDFNVSLEDKMLPFDPGEPIHFPLDEGDESPRQSLTLVDNGEVSYQISPNPVQDQVTLSWRLQKRMDVELRIIDMSGKMFYSKEFIDCREQRESLSIANWTEGIYIVQLITKEGIKHLQLVKQ